MKKKPARKDTWWIIRLSASAKYYVRVKKFTKTRHRATRFFFQNDAIAMRDRHCPTAEVIKL